MNKKCLSECDFKYYLRDEPRTFSKDNDVWKEFSAITLKHNQMPDLVIRHLPELTLMSLVCNFGGLLGMWLGFSILTTFKGIRDYPTIIYIQTKECLQFDECDK